MDRQRIDKWLWHARVVRTRTAAAALVAGGHVRINGERVSAASRAVKVGDVLTVALDRRVRMMKALGFAERRGAAEAAEALYEEVDTPAPTAAPTPLREAGAGRPTKRDRRALDWLRGSGEE